MDHDGAGPEQEGHERMEANRRAPREGNVNGAPLPTNEAERLKSLYALGILDSSPEERFDRLTRLAARLFDVPIALVSLVDADRQWFKSRNGLDLEETPREHSFCAHAILGEDVMIVPDASADDRFRENPLVTGAPDIRFYAGCPIKAPDGHRLGTLCVISDEPREVIADDGVVLRDLAEIVEHELKALALATIDDLTGLTNRRGFEAVGHHVLGFCHRVERPATLLAFDLDGFKEVNDTHGHAEGDRVLLGFAEALLSTFRESDVVSRLGGDEFCVMLSGAVAPDVERPLTTLKERLGDWVGPHSVTFSVGVVEFDHDRHHSLAEWLTEADRAMYSAKRAGR
jgi:diguanylate cyclase (GGDEF)-like protein